MQITPAKFVELLTESCPEIAPVVEEHVSFYGEVLLHLLVSDVRRFCIDRFEANELAVLRRCLDVVAEGLTDGDDSVENAVAVSFVEDTGWWDRSVSPFIEAWPPPLREEAEIQRKAYSNGS